MALLIGSLSSNASAATMTGTVAYARVSENGYVRTMIVGHERTCPVLEFFTNRAGVPQILSVLLAGMLSGRNVKVYYDLPAASGGNCSATSAELR